MASFFSEKKDEAEKKAQEVADKVKEAPKMSVPGFSDMAKSVNDLLSKDFYHTQAANLEVKSKAPNGVNYTVKGKSQHDKPVTGSLEGKYSSQPSGMTGTLTWSTLNALELKVEADENLASGLKLEGIGSLKPESQDVGGKFNIFFKQPAFHLRVYADLLKGPTANIDAVIGHEGFMVGGEAGYDVQKAAITKYSAAIGYQQSGHNATILASNNLSIFAASYYNKVNSDVEVGAKAIWDSKSSSTVGMELASKYRIDPTSFAKAKIDDRGIAALAYNVQVKPGFTFGLGASFDTQKLNESTHKVGAHFAFEG